MTPSVLSSPDTHTHVYSPPTLSQSWSVWSIDYDGTEDTSFLRLGNLKNHSFHLGSLSLILFLTFFLRLPLITHLEKSAAMSWAVLWRDLWGQKLRPPASSHMSEGGSWHSHPPEALRCGNSLTAASWDPQTPHTIVNGYCFKLLSFGVMCYIATDIQYNNWDTLTGKELSQLRYYYLDELLDNLNKNYKHFMHVK